MLILGKIVFLLYICSVCTSSVSDSVQIKRTGNGAAGTPLPLTDQQITAATTADVVAAIGVPINAPADYSASRILSSSIIEDLSKQQQSNNNDNQEQQLVNRSDMTGNYQLLNSIESTGSSSSILSNKKDAIEAAEVDELEDAEMHTNNHQLAGNTGAGGSASQHNSRHYNHHHSLHHSPMGSYSNSKYLPSLPSSSQSSSSYANNLNLNYIHNLLIKPNSNNANSLSNLLTSNSLAQTSAGSSYANALLQQSAFSSHYYSPPATSSPAAVAASAAVVVAVAPSNSSGGTSIEFAGSPMCGRQQVGVREPRIVGGNSTYEGEFPWAVSIQRHGNHHCGGVIVAKRWILTAAHCVRSQLLGNLIVRTGGHTLTRSNNHINSHLERDYLVDQIVMHGDFSRYDNLTASQMKSSANTNNADIALLRLKHDIQWNEFAWPVCFPSRDAGNFSGHDATVIGWGKLNEKSDDFSNELQKVKLTIIDNKVCQNWFRQAGRDMPIDERIICAGFKNGGKDACHGDSGGPLLSKVNGHYVVVGVVSTGIGCARPLLPGLYSRVSSYISWIENYVS